MNRKTDRAQRGELFFQRPDGVMFSLGCDAMVITPGHGEVFLAGQKDESRVLRDQAAVEAFCRDITADPRWVFARERRPELGAQTVAGQEAAIRERACRCHQPNTFASL